MARKKNLLLNIFVNPPTPYQKWKHLEIIKKKDRIENNG